VHSVTVEFRVLRSLAAIVLLIGASDVHPQGGAAVPVPVMPAPDRVLILPPAAEDDEATVGAPVARDPQLPRDTPDDQTARDPAAPIVSLQEALARAYWTNPRLLAERSSLRGTDYRVAQARSGYGPQLRYSASRGYQRDKIDQVIGLTTERSGWTNTAGAVLNQPLFTFGRLRAAEDAAVAQVAFGRGSLAAFEQQTMGEAIGAYVAVLRDRAAVGLGESQVDILTRQFNDIAVRLQKRDATAADADQVTARLELARAQLERLRSSQAASTAVFLEVVGAPAGDLQAPNPLAVPVLSIEDAYVYAEARNPVIAAAFARERASRAQAAGARAELLPRVDLRGDAGFNTTTPYSNDLRSNELRGAVTISGVIDSGGIQARADEAKANNDADWRLIDDAVRENRREIADAWNSWKSQTAAVQSLELAVAAAESAYSGGREQERAGLRTTTEVLDLANDVFVARANLNSSRADVILAQIRLLAALGALEYSDLLPDQPRYHPEAHFRAVKANGDFPAITPAVRALDSVFRGRAGDRPLRDPAAPIAAGETVR